MAENNKYDMDIDELDRENPLEFNFKSDKSNSILEENSVP